MAEQDQATAYNTAGYQALASQLGELSGKYVETAHRLVNTNEAAGGAGPARPASVTYGRGHRVELRSRWRP